MFRRIAHFFFLGFIQNELVILERSSSRLHNFTATLRDLREKMRLLVVWNSIDTAGFLVVAFFNNLTVISCQRK